MLHRESWYKGRGPTLKNHVVSKVEGSHIEGSEAKSCDHTTPVGELNARQILTIAGNQTKRSEKSVTLNPKPYKP